MLRFSLSPYTNRRSPAPRCSWVRLTLTVALGAWLSLSWVGPFARAQQNAPAPAPAVRRDLRSGNTLRDISDSSNRPYALPAAAQNPSVAAERNESAGARGDEDRQPHSLSEATEDALTSSAPVRSRFAADVGVNNPANVAANDAVNVAVNGAANDTAHDATAGATNDAPATSLTLPLEPPIPLGPPVDQERSKPPVSGGAAVWTVVSSLSVVLGLFFAVVFMSRRSGGGAMATLPKEAFEVLGRAPLSGRQQAQVVRFGDKLILLSVTAGGAESLAEITTAAEVERIAGLCQRQQPGSVTHSFRQVMSQFAREPAEGGFLGRTADAASSSDRDDDTLSEFEQLA